MSPMLATIVDTEDLLGTIVAALVAGVGITIVFSVAIYGATRFADLSRDERPAAATVAAIVAVIALTATIAAVVVGIIVMTRK
jgi:cytochrome c biogenesis protein CcdA